MEHKKYKDWAQFEKNVLLLFSNAKQYNAEGSLIHQDAVEMEKAFLSLRAQFFPPERAGGKRPSDAGGSSGSKKSRSR